MQTLTPLQIAHIAMQRNPTPANINCYLQLAQRVRLPVINSQYKR